MPNHIRNNFSIQVTVIVQENVPKLKWMSRVSAELCCTEVISNRSTRDTPALFHPNTHKGQAYELFPRSAFSSAKQQSAQGHEQPEALY